jgi:hypothetical protein
LKKIESLIVKTFAVALILLMVSVPLMPKASAYTVQQIPPTTVFPSTNKITGTPGQIVDVDINITNVPGIFSFQAFLVFDPTVVKCNDVTDGEFLKRNLGSTMLFPTIDNTNGVAGGGVGRFSPQADESGSGQLMRITFEFIANGFTNLHPRDIMLLNIANFEVPTKIVDVYTANYLGTNYDIKIVGNAIGQVITLPDLYITGYTKYGVEPINIGSYRGQFKFNITGIGVNSDAGPLDFAYANVTIPKSLMWCTALADWGVLIDEVLCPTKYVHDNSTHTIVSFEFTYSTADPVKMVKIQSTNIVPEFTTMLFAIMLALATLAAAVFGKITWTVKRKS